MKTIVLTSEDSTLQYITIALLYLLQAYMQSYVKLWLLNVIEHLWTHFSNFSMLLLDEGIHISTCTHIC